MLQKLYECFQKCVTAKGNYFGGANRCKVVYFYVVNQFRELSKYNIISDVYINTYLLTVNNTLIKYFVNCCETEGIIYS
jgi:hypothetical protein